jgi:site-specific DNA recombinase
MNLILIARVSDIKQVEALPAQELRLRNYAKEYVANHPEIKEVIYKPFDESAYKDDRRKFSELVVEISKYKTKTIVVFDKIDRFTRDASQKEVRIMGSLVDSGNIEMHFPSDNLFINRDSPATDKFRLGIGMLLAKYYSDSSRDNVKRRFAQMLNDKIWVGAAPIGYLNINKGTKERADKDIIVDMARAPHIVKMA